MYKEFFGLKEPPFNLTPDPRFFYMSRRHQEALASLVYGIKERKGFILLTGEIGAGKTTLCRAFLKELNSETTNVALVLNSYLTDVELLQTINDEFGIDSSPTSKKQLIDHLNRFLLAEADKGKTCLLIIDEAQNLGPTVLEQVRMLSNLETESSKLIQIVLMGQPELARILEMPELEQLNQRIMVRCHVGPLDKSEIYHYIRHRLQIAGARINVAVTPPALNRIHRFSKGIPRRINVLCDRALLAAFVAGHFWIDPQTVAAAESEMKSPAAPKALKPRKTASAFHPSVVLVLLALCFLVGGVISAVWLALHMGQVPSPGGFTATAAASEAPAAPLAGHDPPAPVAPRPSAAASSIPAPAAASPLSLEALSTSATLSSEQNWTYDSDGIVRVSDPDLARMAALLTISKLWRMPVRLDNFASYDKPTLLSINLQAIFDGPQMNLRSFETTGTLREALRYEMPLVLELAPTSGKLSPSAALLGASGEKCALGDPRLGRIELALPVLEKLVRRIHVLYVDPDNLALMLPGESSPKVESLRTFLLQQGAWSGKATAVYDEDVSESLKRFQAACNLPATGRLDGPTAAFVAARKQAFRPRLLQLSAAK